MWPHNSDVVAFDVATENAVRIAFAGNTLPTFLPGDGSDEAKSAHRPTVRLLFVKHDRAPLDFLSAYAADHLPRMTGPCDRCLTPKSAPVARLWVPTGGSIVQVECCMDCWTDLNSSFNDLVWR